MGSVVGFDPKVTHEALFLTFGLRNPVIWASEGQIFGFLKKHVLGRKSVQEWSRTDPKAPLEAKLRKRSPRVKILRLRQETTELWPVTSQERGYYSEFFIRQDISKILTRGERLRNFAHFERFWLLENVREPRKVIRSVKPHISHFHCKGLSFI